MKNFDPDSSRIQKNLSGCLQQCLRIDFTCLLLFTFLFTFGTLEKKRKSRKSLFGAKLSVASYFFVSFCLLFMKDWWALHSHAQADTHDDNFLSANERR